MGHWTMGWHDSRVAAEHGDLSAEGLGVEGERLLGTQIMLICARPRSWPTCWRGRDAVLVLFGATGQAKTAWLFSDQEGGEAIVTAVADSLRVHGLRTAHAGIASRAA